MFGNAALCSERGQEDVSHFLQWSLNSGWQVLSSVSCVNHKQYLTRTASSSSLPLKGAFFLLHFGIRYVLFNFPLTSLLGTNVLNKTVKREFKDSTDRAMDGSTSKLLWSHSQPQLWLHAIHFVPPWYVQKRWQCRHKLVVVKYRRIIMVVIF